LYDKCHNLDFVAGDLHLSMRFGIYVFLVEYLVLHVRPVLMVVDSSLASFLSRSPTYKCRCYVTIWELDFLDGLDMSWIVTSVNQRLKYTSLVFRLLGIWTINNYCRWEFHAHCGSKQTDVHRHLEMQPVPVGQLPVIPKTRCHGIFCRLM